MSDKCRNTAYDHDCDPRYARRYGGYCLECANAGVSDLIDQRDALAAEVERLRAAFRGLQSVAVAAQGQWGVPADLMTAFKELAESLDRKAAPTGPDSDSGEAD